MTDHLAEILARKRLEVARRQRHAPHLGRVWSRPDDGSDRRPTARARLTRSEGEPVRVIAEIKTRSPSKGLLRARGAPGSLAQLARDYAESGAAGISVLCDGPGFGGSPLDLRRVAHSVELPVLFKEFVLDSIQLQCARACGASMALLLVRALDDAALRALIASCNALGLLAVVEAHGAAELERAVDSGAEVIGLNARDLGSFSVDPDAAARLVENVPRDRVAVYMSGIVSKDDLVRVSATRADAALVGEGLMRSPHPGATLRAWLTPSEAAS